MSKKNKKRYELSDKNDYIIYLYEILTRSEKCRLVLKDTLDSIKNFINEYKSNNVGKDSKEIVVNYKNYTKFSTLLSGSEYYMFNLIGDHQADSLSYNKFRDLIDKKKKKGVLGFEIRDIDEKVKNHLKGVNKLRNWSNHVPESLLVATIEVLKEKGMKIEDIVKNPVEIYLNEKCTLELIEDLYNESYNFYQISLDVIQSMKKDLRSLTGNSIYIQKVYNKDIQGIESLSRDAVKKSAQIQKLDVV